MTQRRGLGKGLGALIPSGSVKAATGGTGVVPQDEPESQDGDARTSPQVNGEPAQVEKLERSERKRKAEQSKQEAETSDTHSAPRATGETSPEPSKLSHPTMDRSKDHKAARAGEDATTPAEVVDLRDDPESASPADAIPGTPGMDTTAAPVPESEFGLTYAEVDLEDVATNPRQPRDVFDEDALLELSASIKEIGLLQPIVVRPVESGYELVAGERRLRASQIAGLARIPALIRETDDDAMLRDALLENLHRVQLNALEEAAAYSQLLEDFSCTQEELATRIGRSRPQISNTLRLLKLPPGVQRRVAAGVLSPGHARALLGLSDPAEIESLSSRIIAEGLSVRAVEELILLAADDDKPRRGGRKRRTTPVEYREAADSLGDLLETRVKIESGAKRGRVVVEFGDTEDLGRILDLIRTGIED